MSLPEIIGLGGVALMLTAYAGISTGKLSNASPWMHGLNLAGALMVLYSLLFAFNLPAFCVEVAWAGIAAFGLWKALAR